MAEPEIVRMPPNGGGISTRFTPSAVQIVATRERRHWIFWKRWRQEVLASAEYRVKPGDILTFDLATDNDDELITACVRVNGEPVLRLPARRHG